MAPITLKIKRIIFPTLIFTCLTLFIIFLNHPGSFKNQFFTYQTSPQIGRYPGSFVGQLHALAANSSYCNANYGFPKELNFKNDNLGFGMELQKNSPYRILLNVIESRRSEDVPAVTYSTHVTADFVNYLAELARYWDGYISVAAFVTETDLKTTLNQLNRLCFCLPEMSRVSVHLVFHEKFPLPNSNDLNLIQPNQCTLKDSSKFATPPKTSETENMYPVNVCRNVARMAAVTEFVLVSDAQLIPSENLALKFIKMTDQHNFGNFQVFVVPIFEVASSENIPRSKKQLMTLIREETAVYFHRLVCTHCQKFPGMEKWFESHPGDEIKPLLMAKREVPYNRWEPIYIGTKNEPYYNEALSWEGLQDKMLQMLEMCLIGYKFVILDGAFLVHWPGIKKTKNKHIEQWRVPFVEENSRQYNKLLKQLAEKYTPNPQCKLQ